MTMTVEEMIERNKTNKINELKSKLINYWLVIIDEKTKYEDISQYDSSSFCFYDPISDEEETNKEFFESFNNSKNEDVAGKYIVYHK